MICTEILTFGLFRSLVHAAYEVINNNTDLYIKQLNSEN